MLTYFQYTCARTHTHTPAHTPTHTHAHAPFFFNAHLISCSISHVHLLSALRLPQYLLSALNLPQLLPQYFSWLVKCQLHNRPVISQAVEEIQKICFHSLSACYFCQLFPVIPMTLSSAWATAMSWCHFLLRVCSGDYEYAKKKICVRAYVRASVCKEHWCGCCIFKNNKIPSFLNDVSAPLSEGSSVMVSEDCASTTALSTVNDTAQKSPAGVGTSCLECNVTILLDVTMIDTIELTCKFRFSSIYNTIRSITL